MFLALLVTSSGYRVLVFHPVSENELQRPILSNSYLVDQRHKGIRIKYNASFLFLQHAQEYLNPSSAVSLVLLLIFNASDLLAELLMLRC